MAAVFASSEARKEYARGALHSQATMSETESFRQQPRRSALRANVFMIECVLVLAAYLYVLLAPGLLWEDRPVGILRVSALAAFGAVYFARLNLMALWLLSRELSNEDPRISTSPYAPFYNHAQLLF